MLLPPFMRQPGIPAPKMVNGIEQRPIEGVSMVYSFDNATAADTRKTQYFEMIGNRAIYHRRMVCRNYSQSTLGRTSQEDHWQKTFGNSTM